MKDRASAERACKDPNPIIDGRKANVNLAYLGAKPRGNIQLAGKYKTNTSLFIKFLLLLSLITSTTVSFIFNIAFVYVVNNGFLFLLLLSLLLQLLPLLLVLVLLLLLLVTGHQITVENIFSFKSIALLVFLVTSKAELEYSLFKIFLFFFP